MNLLLVEDDHRISEFLARGLRNEGHNVSAVEDGVSGLDQARRGSWTAIILDVMLPGIDGREICRTLRLEQNKTPILMLTALDSTDDVVTGLRLGADDYMSKPFAFDELLARLDTITQRDNMVVPRSTQVSTLQVDDLFFDLEALVVNRNGREIQLTSLEYALLEFLMTQAGKVVSRARILQNVWGMHEDPLTNVVDVYIKRLRTKIDDGSNTKLIVTVRGRGYRLGQRR
ncbi:response regulator transcription factor [Coralliovum pocilloporae]|uniref:response regulator transcription factor n=1 Tax=Coralliovum pocilloporae TaxID=3066369 RepID=UPI0033075A74